MANGIAASESIGNETIFGLLVSALKQGPCTTRELAIILGRGIATPAIGRYLKQLQAIGIAKRIGKRWEYVR
jgi:predicted transcriptional regulator